MNWKENRFGLLSLACSLVLLAFYFLFVYLSSLYSMTVEFNPVFFIASHALPIVLLLLLTLPVLLTVLSFLQKEKSRILPIVGPLIVMVFLFAVVGLPPLPPTITHYPARVSGELLKQAYENQSKAFTSQGMAFTQDYVLSGQEILGASGTGLASGQLCLSLGDFSSTEQNGGFTGGVEGGGEREIRFFRAEPNDAAITAICSKGTELAGTAADSGLDSGAIPICSCAQSEDTCCLLALRIPK